MRINSFFARSLKKALTVFLNVVVVVSVVTVQGSESWCVCERGGWLVGCLAAACCACVSCPPAPSTTNSPTTTPPPSPPSSCQQSPLCRRRYLSPAGGCVEVSAATLFSTLFLSEISSMGFDTIDQTWHSSATKLTDLTSLFLVYSYKGQWTIKP